ncbi:gentisate 1,2-dioxygenase [Variovorax sp. J22G21]|uniref:gentisate 1,2-dioxygenase n=1 Tax=Variovorax fucosicus TaxID=3053517 RepID=UPI0025771FD7|nr:MULTISPECIES: gentisate 1,2-dioxygenase [unclassified Variovorax]MDM0037482.1 gentisate 1,2-dioxygenase [Variovorax sp. J22R193]MDM0062258.1 gentisate 1,2-dioxygenase [Variovorax sp. J22G21]
MDTIASPATLDTLAQRRRYYERIKALNLTPLWEELHALVPREPASPCVPALWRYADIKPHLMESAELITAQEAVRRVLILENPGMPGRSCITQSLYAGLQLIMPGEVAPSHRHVQSALRFIVDGKGAYTTVGGERTTMFPGDFIITPSWAWHDHGNEGLHGDSEPVVWLDGLDIPLVRFFDAGFAENDAAASQSVARPEGHSHARFGHNMVPVRHTHTSPTSPIFSYPYARSREALAALQKAEAPDEWLGWKLRYVNPLTGGAPMPTMATCLQLLPKSFKGKSHRATDGAVYSVVEGRGTAEIAGQRFAFQPQDTFVVPSWAGLRLEADDETVLFSFSDRPVQDAIGIHREQFLDN